MRHSLVLLTGLCLFPFARVCAQTTLQPGVQKYVRVQAPKVVLEHVRVIDGTGHAAVEDQNVVIEGGKITAITAGADVAGAKETMVLDLHGLFGVSGHRRDAQSSLLYRAAELDSQWNAEDPLVVPQMTFSAPRLYLAGGVTTMRTTGSVETVCRSQSENRHRRGISDGPHIDVTGSVPGGQRQLLPADAHS